MSLSIVQYAVILSLLLFLVSLFRWILKLRFHLQFGRFGFFSMTDIRYHHCDDSDHSKPKWSISVGKIKTRLKRPIYSSSSAWITIHLCDIIVSVSDISALRSTTAQRGRQPTNGLNRRLSTMGDSLKRIPWWYSLSIVKYVLKFTSALPAQLLMAGLANYVDVQVENLSASLGQIGMLYIEQLNFSSVLFAAMTRCDITPSSSLSVEPDIKSDSASATENDGTFSFHARRQRHSLKRAEHLFKEKYFEITVQAGYVGFRDFLGGQNQQSVEMCSLPLGSRVAISCHLSAGCLTLKDIHVNMQVDALQIKLDQISQLASAVRSMQPKIPVSDTTRTDGRYKSKQSKPPWIRLFRTFALSIADMGLTSETADEMYMSVRLRSTRVSLTTRDSSRSRAAAPVYDVRGDMDQATWSIFNNRPELATDCIEPLMIRKIRVMGTLPEIFVLGRGLSMTRDLAWSDINEHGNTSQTVHLLTVSVTLQNPKVVVDIGKRQLLEKLPISKRSSAPSSTQSSDVSGRQWTDRRILGGLPSVRLVLTFEKPSLEFMDSRRKGLDGIEQGTIEWSSISLEICGSYTAKYTQSISTPPGSPPLSPGFDSEEFSVSLEYTMRKRRQSRPWTKLFRKSWREKFELDTANKHHDADWVYQFRTTLRATNFGVHASKYGNKLAPVYEHYLLHADAAVVTLQMQMKSESVEENQVAVIWDCRKQHNEVDISLDKLVINGDEHQMVDFLLTIFDESSKFNTPKDANKRDVDISPDLLRHIKVTASATKTSVIMSGIDRGLKGHREVPSGYMDNSPMRDIIVRHILTLGETSVYFTGAASTTSKRLSHQLEKRVDDSTQGTSIDESDRMGNLRASLQRVTIHNMFPSKAKKSMTKVELGNNGLFFWCSHINMTAHVAKNVTGSLMLTPAVVVKKFGITYSIGFHYSLLLLLIAVQKLKQKYAAGHKDRATESPGKRRKLIIAQLQLQINRIDMSITLPYDTKLYLRMDGLRAQTSDGLKWQPSVSIHNITLFGVSPRDLDKWDQLIEFDNVQLSAIKEKDGDANILRDRYQLAMSKLFLRVPYEFLVADIVDNGVNFVKSIKTLHQRIKDPGSFTFFGPSLQKSPTSLPAISLKCDTFRLQMDDDPFEARLRIIWRTGIVEQSNRLALEDAFKLKAQTVKHTPYSSQKETAGKGLDSEQERKRSFSGMGNKEHDGILRRGSIEDESPDARVSDAWQGLQEHNAASWIKHIRSAIEKEKAEHEEARRSDYRDACTDGQLDELSDEQNEDSQDLSKLFTIETLALPSQPPLFDFGMVNMNIQIDKPTFRLCDTQLFVHDIGKGVPLDTKYSTLIPFRLNWSAGETWAQIRDYPIPVLLVPPPASADQPSWSLSGDYVFSDELGNLDATRRITISIVNEESIMYTVDIARTATPAKFYSIVDIYVHTPGMSCISWSVPYQPAVQDISRVLDSFTRPPVDPSSKVGFWDKIRLMIHTRTKISFVGGGDLAFLMKGTRDPYETSERGLGLAKLWRNDVVCLIGHPNTDREVIQIISRDYAFGVPDLENGGFTARYVAPKTNMCDEDALNLTADYGTQGSQPSFPRRARTLSSFRSQVSGERFRKVALKLSDGIRMGIGCQLERICSGCSDCYRDKRYSVSTERSRCRSLHFLPHYKVQYRTPQSVQSLGDKAKDYDAYDGFRSDFIHISISIVKLSAESTDKVDIANATMNSMHLNPGFIDHFVKWFRLFGGAMSYPLRNGTLFPKDDPRPTKKFGKHMSTMKYKIMLHPLTISYFYKDENTVDSGSIEGSGDMVGLKALVAAFNVDIHQRREIINVASHKLDQKRLKANWPMHEVEIHLKNIDLRAVHASFSPKDGGKSTVPAVSVAGTSESSDCSTDPDLMDGLDGNPGEDTEPSDWVDPYDFVDLNSTRHASPSSVKVLPFAFSPCVYYLRQTSPADSEEYRYLRHTHNCIMGTAIDTRELQMSFLAERCRNIDIQIRKHQARLQTVESRFAELGDKSLLSESKSIVDKTEVLFEKRDLIQRYLKELSTQTMPNVSGSHPPDNASYSTSTVFGRDSLVKWEELMGYFKQRCIVHNPQIIWNNAVRNVIYHFLDLQAHKRALSYYVSMRSIKFLRDLADEAQRERRRKPSAVMLDDDDGFFDSAMAEKLIQKLLDEQETNFVALNEIEEGVEKDKPAVIASDSEQCNVNDPVMQKDSIPEGYEIKSNFLVDMLHPQISLQSDRDPDSLVLLANERIQVKGLNIMDTTEPDVEMELVKKRTIVSLDNLHVFVAKKEQFDSVDLLLYNHYGAKQSDRWLAWIPLEMLINYVDRTDKFQRVAHKLAATIQYDKYNQLRFKTKSTVFAETHPFEERCDSVHLNLPELAFTANSSQYNAVYEVVTDLLLYKEPAKKERLARLREILMASDRTSPYDAMMKIAALQDRVRQLLEAHYQYRQNLALLNAKQIEEFRTIQAALQESREDLYLAMEAIKLTQTNQRKDYDESKTNLKFVFSARKLLWEMRMEDNTPLCEWNLSNTTYILISKEDRSSSNTLEVDTLSVKNTSPSPVFTDVLGPYYVNPQKVPDFSRHKMLRGYLVDLAPVGGIPVVQHLEINLFPLKLQMTYEFGKALASYFFPAERRQKQAGDNAPRSPSAPQSPNSLGHSTSLTGNDFSESKDIQQSVSNADMHASYSTMLDDGDYHDPTVNTLKDTDATSMEQPTVTLQTPPSSFGRKGLMHGKRKKWKKSEADDLSVMKKRASTNRTFILVKIPGTKHCLSYQGQKEKNIEDLREFVFQQPNLEYRNKTWSWYELLSTIKKDFLRAAVLHNSTALLKEKLTIRRHQPREHVTHLGESTISMHSTSSAIPEDLDNQHRFLDDQDHLFESTDSSQDEYEDGELENDAVSLHSLSLWEPEQHVEQSHTRRLLPWARKSKKLRNTEEENIRDDKRPSIDSIDIANNSSGAITASSLLDEDLTAKGRLLLGKRYNGPIYSLSSSTKAGKGKGTASSSRMTRPESVKSLGG